MSEQVDVGATIAARSDQLNADDLLAGPMTATVKRVRAGDNEQPIWIDLDCWSQPWKPSKTMRRVLVECWGTNGAAYVGRSVTLFRNPDIKFGGIKVGGIEISHLSHIERPHEIALAVSRGKKQIYTIRPMQAKQQKPNAAQPVATPGMTPVVDAMRAKSLNQLKIDWAAHRKANNQSADAEEFRLFVSETTKGRVGMSDALDPMKYTSDDFAACRAAITPEVNVDEVPFK